MGKTMEYDTLKQTADSYRFYEPPSFCELAEMHVSLLSLFDLPVGEVLDGLDGFGPGIFLIIVLGALFNHGRSGSLGFGGGR